MNSDAVHVAGKGSRFMPSWVLIHYILPRFIEGGKFEDFWLFSFPFGDFFVYKMNQGRSGSHKAYLLDKGPQR